METSLEKPFSTKSTGPLLGDVLQSWNFLWHFGEVLGLKTRFSFEELMTKLNGPVFDVLFEAHTKMLQVLISEFPRKLEHNRKRTMEHLVKTKRSEINMPPLNGLTWLELARRYVLAISLRSDDPDSKEVCEGIDVFDCLQGGVVPKCGALTKVAGLEADARFLATAINKIFRSLCDDSDKLTMDDLDSNKETTRPNIMAIENIPDWVQELEPVKMLKTNNGSKIRACIYNSLEKEPPEWAREILDHSISKEVYKGNASGPTKKLVLNVVSQFRSMQKSLAINKRTKNFLSISDIVMKQCRIVLRRAASTKKTREFRDWLGAKLVMYCNNEDGLPGSPVMVFSLLYLRIIDMRLAAGAYCGSHRAFYEDVLEFWRNVQIAFRNDSHLVTLAKESCNTFESLYNREVIVLHKKLVKYSKLDSLNANAKKDIESILVLTNEIPQAPWDEGVCRVCGIDETDKKVLLCDACNAEYHTYCLNPPLTRIPKEKWYCHSCVTDKANARDVSLNENSSVCQRQKKNKGEFITHHHHKIVDLAAALRGKEYWELSSNERILLLSFFCDEMLDSTIIREHLRECASSLDAKTLKYALRSDFVGVDDVGKFYWIIDSSSNPWIIVNEIDPLYQSRMSCEDPGLECSEKKTSSWIEYLSSPGGLEAYSSWSCYQSSAEIKTFMDSLKEDNPIKKQLENSILACQQPTFQVSKDSESQQNELQPSSLMEEHGQNCIGLSIPMTKAAKLLESNYGPFVKLDTCDSLKKQNKGKVVVEGKLHRCQCLEPILPVGQHCLSCHKTSFTTMEFKLHGNGKCIIKSTKIGIAPNVEGTTKSTAQYELPRENLKIVGSEDGCSLLNSSIGSSVNPESKEGKFFNVPESSLWPSVGKPYDVLTKLKIDLLDMEAAIPKDAMRSSKACIDRRWAWHAFVKCASTIYEMVEALVVFEDMIKLEYLNCSWRYWSSLLAAANISTLTALALRIYSLDAAISYNQIFSTSNSFELLGMEDNGKPRKKQRKE